MTREQLISLFFLALLVFVIYQIVLIFSPFFRAIFWSAILAFAFFPVYEKVKPSFGRNETLAALVTTLAIFLIVVPPVILVIITVAGQAIEFYQSAVVYIREGGLERLIEQIRSWPPIQRAEARVFQWDPLKENVTEWVLSGSRGIGNFAAGQATSVTKNALAVILNILFMVFLLFVFLKDGKKIYDFVYQIAPLEERSRKSIFKQINETFSAVIRGQLLTSFTQALVAGTVFWALGLPVPVLFAALTFLAALIPVVGASAVWLPLAISLVVGQHYVKATILFIFGVLVISLIDNVMKPALIGEKTRLPYFLLFFGILGGLKLYGLMGIFLAPVVLSLFFALVKIYQEKYL
jgi:predicted PurR-regulated permease PerM